MTAPKLLPCPFCGSEAEMLGGPMAQDCYDVWCKSKQGRHHLRGTMDPVKTAERWNTRALATPDQIAALAAERAATVTVKPLVWSPFMNGYCLHTDTRLAACSTAESIIWTYAIGRKHTYMKTTKPEERAFDDHLSSAWWVEAPSRKLIGPFNSDVLAKAAAQADYDARIRSAITITSGVTPDTIPLPRAEVEALMEAASDAASELASIRHHIAAAIVKKALATLQERMK